MSPEDSHAQEPQVEQVSSSFRISLKREGQFVRFPISEDKYYFRVQAPPIGNDMGDDGGQTIEIADAKFTEDGDLDREHSTFRFRVKGEDFVAKCIAQVTDFCVPLTDEQGNPVERTFDAKNRGDNRNNREVFEFLPDVAECKFRTILNGAMDFVAGANGQARKDFEELLVAEPRYLGTS